MKKRIEQYVNMCHELGASQEKYPFILEVTENSGDIRGTRDCKKIYEYDV